MIKHVSSFILSIFLFGILSAQNNNQWSGKHNGKFTPTKDGVISGKVTDSVSKSPIASATIFVYRQTKDSSTGAVKEMLAGNAVTKSDGSFEVNSLPSPAHIRVQISVIGYDIYNKTVLVSPRTQNKADIGKVLMRQTSSSLTTVNVTAQQQGLQMNLDKKVFNVAQSLASSGQTAQEVLAQMPTVSVDIDGNASVRGSSPQIYVDGMPTMLTLDQIPSDLIDKVELMTNPSAKYDASTGGGGIINIILKKNNTKGYNGGINGGGDTRGGWNIGGDLNLRLGKFNVFARANHRSRKNPETNHTERNNLDSSGNTTSSIYQKGKRSTTGSFNFFSLGTDYNLDKRNVFTISGNYVRGTFDNSQPQTLDSLYSNGTAPNSYGNLISNSTAGFKNLEGEFKFKHNFSEDGDHNLLIDLNYNHGKFHNISSVNTATYGDEAYDPNTLVNDQWRNTLGNSTNSNFIFQGDYVNPITKNSKIEAGVRGQIGHDAPTSYQYLYTSSSLIPSDFDITDPLYLDSSASSRYKSRNEVFAAYGIFSSKVGEKLSYELGGRVESSNYRGTYYTIPDNVRKDFKVKYPLEFFPSAFVTYNIADGQDLQANYSRKVNRPNFFQLMPMVNQSDPYNIQQGNPDLKPEFTSMYELSYNNKYKNGNFLGSVYYRHTSNLITSYQYEDSVLNGGAIVNTYENAESSEIYGLELDNSFTVAKIWNLDLNYNLFNSIINADSALNAPKNQRWSWFAKWNNHIQLPAGLTFELNGQYYAKTVLPNTSGGGAQQQQQQGGGPRFGQNNVGSTQGYVGSRYEIDAALKKDIKWGKGNTLSLTASINDIFGTNKTFNYSQTDFMTQDSYRLRQPRVVRFTLSYRFGRFDKNLFKKKGPQGDDNGGDDMGGGMDMGG